MKNIKIKFNSLIYFAILLLSFKAVLFPSVYFKLPSILETLIELLSYSIIIYGIMKDKKNVKNILILMFLGIICLVSALMCQSMLLFSSFLLFCIAIDKDDKKIIRIIYRTVFIVVLIHFFMFLVDYIKGNTRVVEDVYGRIRYSIGFNNPNIAGFFTLWCYLGYCYADSKGMWSKIFAFILVFIIYQYTDCRSLLLIASLYLLLCCSSKNKKISALISKLPLVLFIIILCITFLAIFDYGRNGKFGMMLDKISNQRIYYSYRALKIYGPTVWGRTVDTRTAIYGVNDYDWLVLDNVYAYCVYGFGMIHLLFLIFIAYYISKLNNIEDSKLFICWVIYAFFELSNMNFIISFAPILGAPYLNWSEKK